MSAPAIPVLEAVWTSLVEAIAGIRKGADYHTTVRTVVMDLDLTPTLAPRDVTPLVLVLADADASSRADRMGGIVDETLVFQCECRIDVDVEGMPESTGKLEAFARFKRDIEFAVTRDITRGGIASGTYLKRCKGPFFAPGSPIVFFQQEITVRVVRMAGE